jgi:hypothetical protein
MFISREPRPPATRSLDQVKLAVAGVGIVVWAYGAKVEDARVRWLGIALLALAFLLRFLRRRAREE